MATLSARERGARRRRRSAPAQLAARGPRAQARARVRAADRGDLRGLPAALRAPRVCASPEADLGLLAGDQLYALGLARLVALGDLAAVAELADVITLSALAQGAGERTLADALWAAGARAVGWGSQRAHRRAKALARAGAPDALAAMRQRRGAAGAAADRASILFAAPCPDKHAQAQVQVHPRPPDAGRVRGRDRHAPALHDRHRARRRRDRGRCPSRCRRSASRSARSSRTPHSLGSRRDRPTVPRQQLHPGRDHADPRASARPARRRCTCAAQPRDRHRPLRPHDALHRDHHALRAPRLPGALGRRRRALHLPLPRRRLRPAGLPRRRAAAAAAGPLLHARRRRPYVQLGPRFSVNSELRASPRATPASRSTASASTSTRRGPDAQIGRLTPDRAQAPSSPRSLPPLQAPPPRPARATARAARSSTPRTPASASSTGSTSAPR